MTRYSELEKHKELERYLTTSRGKELLKEHSLRRSLPLTQQRRLERTAAYPIAIYTSFRKPAGTIQRDADTLNVLHYYQEGTAEHENLRRLSERLKGVLKATAVVHRFYKPKTT